MGNPLTAWLPVALLVASTVGSPYALAQDEDPAPLLTLDEALELARRHAPSLRSADEGVQVAEAQALEAIMARLPILSGRATISPSGPIRGNPIDSPSRTDIAAVADIFDELGFQLNSSLRGTQPLYTFGKIALAEDLADVGIEVAEMRRHKAELELIFDVTRAYLALQLSIALDELIIDGQRRLDDAREELEERLFEGDPTARTQLRQLTIEEASFTGRITDNRTLAHLARLGLAYYCGIEGEFRVTPLDDEQPLAPLADLAEVTELAYHHRPDLALLDRAVEASDIEATRAWRELVPNLFFAFGLTFNYNPLADNQISPFASDPYNTSGIGFLLGVDWSFDFRQLARARLATAEAEQRRVQRDEATGAVEIDIAQAYYDALGQQEEADAYGEALAASQAWLRQRTLQFDSGLADYDDLSEPLLAYFSTYGSYYETVFDNRLARANLALKLGLESLEPGVGLVPQESEGETPAE